ncbi:MarR family winged helix-turn-helix transcriptional regulator [Celerinatantimonas sp. YJH-8]|uniref:MarR family winged helix-turn-helix transcriptional regulator n=1 Tax=Celerinatantimonas sp. YJH-8 TaxID=3228714 RepID=UPI0038CBECFC
MIKTKNTTTPPKIGEGKRGKDGYLGYLLRQAAGSYRHCVERTLSDLQLTQPQFSVMTMLEAYPGYSNADLARLALLTPQTMSVIVTNLVKRVWVVRHAHQIHGRIQTLELTELGQQTLQAAKQRVYTIEKDLLAVVPEEHETIIKEWLIQVATLGEPAKEHSNTP